MNKLFLTLSAVILIMNCNAQLINCNRQVYGTKKYIDKLPTYICIPEAFIIDDYIREADLDMDGINDFLALKYNRKEDDQIDGELTYWRFYYKIKPDTVYRLRETFNNLVPPFIKDISLEYLVAHPLADKIFQSFPRRISNKLSFQIKSDTIKLSYKIDDTYGKSFSFKNLQSKWTLVKIDYFIGELPDYWWNDDNFYYPLQNQLKYIESINPKINITLDEFDLSKAFEFGRIEAEHLAGKHVDAIKKIKNQSILDVNFTKCQNLKLPDNWIY